MKKIGFITCQEFPHLTSDDRLLFPLFKAAGIEIVPVIWDQPTDYNEFDLLVFRSAWDYHNKTTSFFAWLQELKQIKTPIANPIAIIEQNYDKYYLKDIYDKGFSIIPTLFFEHVKAINLAKIMEEMNWQKGVIKPTISMSAYHTYSFDQSNYKEIQRQLTKFYGTTKVMVQKFAPEITSIGEWSLVFFDKKYAMTALKKPKKGDFRVQSELGGTMTFPEPPTNIIAQAEAILNSYEADILYARMDGIIHNGQFQLMEAELIDPELYFSASEKGRKAFLEAILKKI